MNYLYIRIVALSIDYNIGIGTHYPIDNNIVYDLKFNGI